MNNATADLYRNMIDRYMLATGQPHYEMADVYAWAAERGELQLSPDDVRDIHISRFSEAARSHKRRDACGRLVRLRHCVTVEREAPDGTIQQCHLWSHIADASREFMRESLLQRCRHVRRATDAILADLAAMNECLTARGEHPIQLAFDFSPAPTPAPTEDAVPL